MNGIKIAETDNEIERCFHVMSELRPHLREDEFVERVRRQGRRSGFQLVYLSVDDGVKAVAGIRIAEWLAGGTSLEIEDLVAAGGERSKGYGGQLFDWIVEYARQNGCDEVKLVSAVTRFAAHRFYLNKRMIIQAHYFSMPLK